MSFDEGEISLKDAVKFIVDNRGKTAPTVESGIALIATNCVNNKDLYPQKLNLRYVSHETYETWFRAHPEPGDILLTNKGSQNGAICLVPDPVDFCIAQDMVALRADPKKIYPLFLFAALRSELVQQRIKALNVDAVIPHLKKTDFDKLLIPLPNEDAQRWIGDWYFEMCLRIEVLRETNATLEAVAQALFKSWFVDFDPVRAKMAGRAPEGMDEATAALFPDALEESELGLVPEGWRVGRLDDLLVLQRGFDLPAQDREPGDYPIIAASGPSGTHREARVGGPGVVTGRSGVLGRVFLEFGDYWPLNTTLWIKDFRAATACFAYELLRLLDFKSFNAGSAVPTLNRNHIHGLPYVIPPEVCVKSFDEIARPLHQRVKDNERQAQALADLRDTLLPRLISGQLRLPDAQAQVEDALA